jgi:hypothetical protein
MELTPVCILEDRIRGQGQVAEQTGRPERAPTLKAVRQIRKQPSGCLLKFLQERHTLYEFGKMYNITTSVTINTILYKRDKFA